MHFQSDPYVLITSHVEVCSVQRRSVVAPDAFVEAVVEVEMLKVLELAARRAEELLHHLNMWVHRAANVQKQQHAHRIVPLRARLHVQVAMLGRGADGPVEIQLLDSAIARPFPKPFQCHLDVAGAELDLVVEVAELALVPDLHGALVTGAILPDPHALGIVAEGAEG